MVPEAIVQDGVGGVVRAHIGVPTYTKLKEIIEQPQLHNNLVILNQFILGNLYAGPVQSAYTCLNTLH